MPDPNYTHLVFVIDRSGSMATIKNDMVGALSTLVADQAKDTSRCTLSAARFDYPVLIRPTPAQVVINARAKHPTGRHASDGFEWCARFVTLDQAPDFATLLDPRGGTALYDNLCRAIDEEGAALAALPEEDRPGKVLVIVVTDGEENSSQLESVDTTRRRIETQEGVYNWHFLYFGADHDAVLAAAAMGIKADQAMTYEKTSGGIEFLGESASRIVSSARTSSPMSYKGCALVTTDDRAKQKASV